MSEHTRTPWSCRRAPGTDQEWWINAEHGDKDLGHVRWQMMAVAYGCDDMGADGAAKAKANARHIVHCVNNYERLVAMLEEATTQLEIVHYHDGNEFVGARAKEARTLLAALEAEKGERG